MSRSDRIARIALAAGLGLAVTASAASATGFGLGRTATVEEIAGWDIDVRPDGQGLPDGEGSVDDGEAIYEASCAVCHGSFGESNEYMALAGGVGSLKSDAPVRTVGSKLNYATTLFDYINRAMPYTHSKSLSADEVYAVSGYVLNLNDIVDSDFIANRETLVAVQMPNRDGYAPFPGLSRVDGKSDVQNTACMRDCEKEVAISGTLPEGFVESMYGDIDEEFRGLATMNRRAPSGAMIPAAARAGSAAAAPQELVGQHGCTVCHGIDRAIVGPGFRAVAEKYAGDAAAEALLRQKIRDGGSGTWGDIPMPPQVGPGDAELDAIVRWTLDGAPDK